MLINKLIGFCIILFLPQTLIYAKDLKQDINKLLWENDLQGLETLAESHGGWPALLSNYPDMLYITLEHLDSYNNRVDLKTLLFLVDKEAHLEPYPVAGKTYFYQVLIMLCTDRELEPLAARLISSDLDPHLKDVRNRSYLHYLCEEPYSFSLNLAEILINNGTDIDVADSQNETPILLAVSSNQTEMVKLLLKQQVSLENPDILFKAAQNNNLEILKILLDNGMDINVRNERGETLINAVFSFLKPSEELLTFLMDNHSDLSIPSLNGNTVLHNALKNYRCKTMLPSLMRYHPEVNVPNNDGIYPIHLAATAESVNLLLQAGANPNERSNRGETPIGEALWRRDIDSLKALIDGGANVNALDENGNPYLFTAVSNHSKTRLLLENGADPKQMSKMGENILFDKTYMEASDIWNILPIPEEYVNNLNCDGYTPLRIALEKRYFDFAYELIQKGANYLIEAEKDGKRPVDMVLERKSSLQRIQTEAPKLHAFFLSADDFQDEYQAKLAFYHQKDLKIEKKQKKKRIITNFLTLGIPLIWLSLSFLFREKLSHNPFIVINSSIFMAIICAAAAGLIFRALTPHEPGFLIDREDTSFIIGACIGFIGGIISGIVLKDKFKRNSWLYYTAPSLATLGSLYFVIAY
ncbi:MAG: ankyrin repeat domain-containing protein [Spirochaetales bacterium]|nr:ankyrin repeat domain-containing protein [Spirochaetales bacterium]